MMNNHGGDGASLVLVCADGEVLAVGQFTMDRMPPGEHWRRLTSASDLPEGSPVGANCFGTCLTFVDGGCN